MITTSVRLRWLGLVVSLSTIGFALADGVPRDVVRFDIAHLTMPGESVFVMGNRPELGGNNIRKAVKMLPQPDGGGGLLWTIDIAIPLGPSFN